MTLAKSAGRGAIELGRYPELEPPGKGPAKCNGPKLVQYLQHLRNTQEAPVPRSGCIGMAKGE